MSEGKELLLRAKISGSMQLAVIFKSKKGYSKPTPIDLPEVSSDIDLESVTEEGIEIDLDLDHGKPKRIRVKGSPFLDRTASGASSHANLKPAFHNPYNFIPTPPRRIEDPVLGDSEYLPSHPDHGVFQADRISGTIRVRVTTVTPMLLPDAGAARSLNNGKDNGHKSYPVREDSKGRAALHPASLKGMLRAAFEAVTNSRFPPTAPWDHKLAYRAEARVTVQPAIVTGVTENSLEIKILRARWQNSPAKLKRFGKYFDRKQAPPSDKGMASFALRYPDGSIPVNGEHVLVQVDEKGWVTQVRRFEPGQSGRWREGWVLATGPNFSTKVAERVFVISPDEDDELFLEDGKAREVKKLWSDLIRDYQTHHVKDLQNRALDNRNPEDYLGDKPGETGWSIHIHDKSAVNLTPGKCVYIERIGDRITGLYPVSISRKLFPFAPNDLQDKSLRTAAHLGELSPADRVFGWVSPGGLLPSNTMEIPGGKKGYPAEARAWKGCLRVKNITCLTEHPIEKFPGNGLPLNILGQPKPQQARFYCASNRNGDPLAPKTDIAKVGYQANAGLRGRKVYPHQNGIPANHWNNPTEDRTQISQGGWFQEYRRSGSNKAKERDSQNRTIQGWVRQGTVFEAEIQVQNLSRAELGCLLWLASLPDGHYLRLGGGKPFGFGSVKLSINMDETRLGTGTDWAGYYSLRDGEPERDMSTCVDDFKVAVSKAFQKPFDSVPYIASFLRSCTGFDDRLPVHYPRIRRPGFSNGPVPPDPEGKSYEWFVENNRVGGLGFPLPSILKDTGLPLLEPTPDQEREPRRKSVR